VAGLDWPEALLIGAVLSPTDPVFAAALVGNDKVPDRLRHLLNVESGVNDGLALPFFIVFLAVTASSKDLHLPELAFEILLGVAVGVAIPVMAILLERLRIFAASGAYEPLNGVAIGLLVLAVAQTTHANLFLAAFTAGITVATFGPRCVPPSGRVPVTVQAFATIAMSPTITQSASPSYSILGRKAANAVSAARMASLPRSTVPSSGSNTASRSYSAISPSTSPAAARCANRLVRWSGSSRSRWWSWPFLSPVVRHQGWTSARDGCDRLRANEISNGVRLR
jgi:hypothetical protein